MTISGFLPPSTVLRARTGAAVLVALGSLGCSVATAESSSEAELGSTQAVVQVHVEETSDGDRRGDALAGFVRLPASADRETTLRLAGLVSTLPAVGSCREEGRVETAPVAELSRIELLDADTVLLESALGVHELAPHAFPTVTDWIRGVVHTSRDREATHLGPGSTFRVLARGVDGLTDLDALAESPAALADVTLGGLPFDEVDSLPLETFLDVSWSPASGSPSADRIAVGIETTDRHYACSFADGDGAGSVPVTTDGVPLFVRGSEARVSIHRLRTQTVPRPGDFDLLEVHFDFSVGKRLRFD